VHRQPNPYDFDFAQKRFGPASTAPKESFWRTCKLPCLRSISFVGVWKPVREEYLARSK